MRSIATKGGELYDAEPPNNKEFERYCLGAWMLKPSLIRDEAVQLSSDDFHGAKEKALFEAIIAIDADGAPVELPEIQRRMRAAGTWDAVLVAECHYACVSAAHWWHYAAVLRDLSAKRKAIRAAEELIRGAHDDQPAGVVLSAAQSELSRIAQNCGVA